MPEWTTLEMLQPGAVFKTHDGVLAIKSNRYTFNAHSKCTLLADGEPAYFLDGNNTEVQEIPLALVEAAPDLLAACEKIHALAWDEGLDVTDVGPARDLLTKLMMLARDALIKADQEVPSAAD